MDPLPPTIDQAGAPPPPGSGTQPVPPVAERSSGSRVGRVILGLLLVIVGPLLALLFLVVPLVTILPSFWLAVIVAALVLGICLWFASRVLPRWVFFIGTAVFVVPFLILFLAPLGSDPIRPKPAPWAGAAWDTEQVDYWDLSTGSRIGFVHFEAERPNGAAPILFLHGGPGGGVVPSDGDMAQALASNGFDVYLFDQAGVGWSDLLDVSDYSLNRMVDDVEAIRESIGTDTVNLVGHSWGGSLAAHYTATYDSRVDGVWLNNPGEYGGSYEKDETEEPDLTASTSGGIPLNGTPPARFIAFFITSSLGATPGVMEDLATQEQLIRYAPDFVDTVDTFQENRCAANPFDAPELEYVPQTNFNFYALEMISRDVSDHDPTEGLDQITTPMVIARGVCDFIPWESQRIYRDTVPDARLIVVPGEGHDMRPVEEMSAFFLTGDPISPPYTDDDVPQPDE